MSFQVEVKYDRITSGYNEAHYSVFITHNGNQWSGFAVTREELEAVRNEISKFLFALDGQPLAPEEVIDSFRRVSNAMEDEV
jgi:hypothetical protein